MVRLITLLLCFFSFNAFANVLTGKDVDAKLPFWEWRSENVSIRLVQRLPDQSRAYFMARNFTAEQAELIAQSCVFQTIFKNIAPPGQKKVISYDLSEWDVKSAGRKQGLVTREAWKTTWKTKNAAQAARIAFEWSLMPTRHHYQPGDFNWGMTIYGLSPGTRFDLQLVWYENDEQKKAAISDIECAPDIHPDPESE